MTNSTQTTASSTELVRHESVQGTPLSGREINELRWLAALRFADAHFTDRSTRARFANMHCMVSKMHGNRTYEQTIAEFGYGEYMKAPVAEAPAHIVTVFDGTEFEIVNNQVPASLQEGDRIMVQGNPNHTYPPVTSVIPRSDDAHAVTINVGVGNGARCLNRRDDAILHVLRPVKR